MKNKIVLLLFCLILILGSFLRLMLLSQVPNGLQQDETSIAYNAYSILMTGKDEYGKSYPLYFKAFGEYKLPLSIYLTTISFALFGISDFSVRFPSVFFGIGTIILVYFLAKEFFKKDSVALISMCLIAFNPWHIHFSRGAYEVTPSLFFITLGVYLYLIFIKKSSIRFLTGSILSFALSMYGYNIARLFVPLFLISLFILNIKTLRKINFSKLILPILCLVIILHALFIAIFNTGGYESTTGTLIPSSAVVQAANLEVRSYVSEYSQIIAKVFFNSYLSDLVYYFKNVISYLNVDFLFLSGSKHGNHGVGNVGQFYMFEIITILIGIVAIIQQKSKSSLILLAWILLVILVASLTREAPYATRSFFAIPPLIMISGVGFYYLSKRILKYPISLRLPLFAFLIITILFLVVQYLSSYFIRFPKLYAKNYRSEDKEIVQYLEKNYDKYDVIYIDNKADLIYTSILYYSHFSPLEFQKDSIRARDDSEGFSKVSSFGKYQYIDISNIPNFENALLVTNQNIAGMKEVKRFDYPKRPVVVAQGQEIINFPVTENAYVLLEKN